MQLDEIHEIYKDSIDYAIKEWCDGYECVTSGVQAADAQFNFTSYEPIINATL